MNSINTNGLQEMDLSKPEHKISAITTITKGKRFESYVGWSFAQALKSDKYLLGVKYNFSKEEERLYEIIKKLYLDINTRKTELEKVESKIKKFRENSQELPIYYPKESSSSASSTKGNEQNKSKSNKEIKGDFDVIIPNVKKEDFLKMLENNFYSKKVDKCILYEEERISKLPQYFNLYIEVGLSTFYDYYKHKIQQIKKYMAIVNFAENIIDNEEIRCIYKKDFQSRFSLHLNKEEHEIADKAVYMLITNSDYGEFTRRFLDDRNSLNIRNNEEYNSVIPTSSKEVLLFAFVDFLQILNCYRQYESIKRIDDQLKKMDSIQKELKEMDSILKELKKMDSMQKELDDLKLFIRNSMDNNNNFGHYNYIDDINNIYYSQFNDYNYSNNYYIGHNNYNYDYNDYYSFNYNHDIGNNNYFYNNYYYHY